MWRTVCALIAAVWFFAGIVIPLHPLVGLGFLALAFVDWTDVFGERASIRLTPRDPGRPADD